PFPVGQDRHVFHFCGGHDRVGGGHTVGSGIAWWRRDVETGVTAQGQFHGGGAEGASDAGRVVVAGAHAEPCGGRVLGVAVRVLRRDEGEAQVFGFTAGQGGTYLLFDQGRLVLGGQSGDEEFDLVAETGEAGQSHLQSGGWCLTSGSAQVYPVGALLGELHGVQSCGHVGSGIACPGDLVHQLGGDGAWGHRTPAAWVFGDGRAAVGVDLGDREPGVGQVVAVVCQFFGVGVVAAGGLGSAFDDMAGHGGPGQCVEVLPFPSEVGDGGSQGQGGVGDPAGDDDVGTCVQAGGDTEGAQVGVGGQWCAEVEFLGPVEEIVAGDAGDAGGKAELVGQ